MSFECPKKIEADAVPQSNLFDFVFEINMTGGESTNINYSTKSVTFSTKPIKYDILQMNISNNGINNPISKHWPLIETWKTVNTKKKIKILGKMFPINVPLLKPTQVLYEIYTLNKSEKITFFTIPSFKFQMNSDVQFSGSVSCEFSISVEGKGACLLQTSTAGLIDNFYNDGKQILQMSNASDRTNRIINMLANPKFELYVSATALLTYLLRDGLAANFKINKAGGSVGWQLNTFYIEFGDLKITIPKFQIKLDFPDILKDPVTGQDHPVTVSGSPETGLTVTVQLLTIPNGDFFGLMLTSLQNTLKIAQSATGTSYDANYVKELEDILTQLQDGDDEVTKWLEEYLGMEYTLTFYFVFCPAGMSNVPPTPFYLKVELVLNINPYKILDELFDAAEVIEKTMSTFENDFWNYVDNIKHTSFAHPLEKMLQGAMNTLNKELLSVTESAQKEMDNKYVNKQYNITLSAMIPIEPPP